MQETDFGFQFQRTGLTELQGPNSVGGEFFTTVDLSKSIVRETIQNSLDAKRDSYDGPVVVEFELRTVESHVIPGIHDIRWATELALQGDKKYQGMRFIRNAYDTARSDSVKVLRIGDYGTKGLEGNESKKAPVESLTILARGTGLSPDRSGRGGSFGIGSSVGVVASDLRTVGYASRAIDKPDEVVYASKCRLMTFVDDKGAERSGIGFYTDRSIEHDFRFWRHPQPVPGFPPREDYGTDVYVYGYIEAELDPRLELLKRAAIENFYVAIHRGKLIVRGVTEHGDWEVSQETLPKEIAKDTVLQGSLLPFFRALTETEPIVGPVEKLGEGQLYVWVDDRMPKRLGAHVMRKPLMVVDRYDFRFHIPFAAVFICEDEDGDSILREIEPASHDKWSEEGLRSNENVVAKIKDFIRAGIRSRIPDHTSGTMRIKGLEKFLPLLSSLQGSHTEGNGTSPSPGEPSPQESAAASGKAEEKSENSGSVPKPIRIPNDERGAASPEGSETGRTGRRRGQRPVGPDPRRQQKSKIDPDQEGVSQIDGAEVGLRVMAPGDGDHMVLILEPSEDVSGDLTICGLGSSERDVFPVNMKSAALLSDNAEIPLEVSGDTFRNLKLTGGTKAYVRVEFETGLIYRLGLVNG